jgi:4-diphosphocytidyl-2-C-methyl-D-erythritol kinase
VLCFCRAYKERWVDFLKTKERYLLYEIFAHAKINLTLDITGLRSDGYHEVEMIMQTVGLSDRLVFESHHKGIFITCDTPGLPVGPENLVYKAALLLQEYTGQDKGAIVYLKKDIPLAAGLAGGSADAAAALKGLNNLWGLNLHFSELLALGERIGADVPFCLMGGTALARGKGEILLPLKPLPRFGVILVKPPFGVSTGCIYQQYDLTGGGVRPDTKGMLEAIEDENLLIIGSLLSNVLEETTAYLYPQIDFLKQVLIREGAVGAAMSGSGPTYFGLFEDEVKADLMARNLILPPGWLKIVTSVENG